MDGKKEFHFNIVGIQGVGSGNSSFYSGRPKQKNKIKKEA